MLLEKTTPRVGRWWDTARRGEFCLVFELSKEVLLAIVHHGSVSAQTKLKFGEARRAAPSVQQPPCADKRAFESRMQRAERIT